MAHIVATKKPNKVIKKLIPNIKFEWEGRDKDKGNNEDQQWKLKLIFTLDIAKSENNRVAFQVQLTLSLKKSLSTFISDINGVKNTATISSTTLGIKLEVLGDIDLSINTDWGKKNPTIKSSNYFSEVRDAKGNITDYDDYRKEKNYTHNKVTQKQEQKKREIEKSNATAKIRNDKRDAFTKLVNSRTRALNETKQVVRIVNIMVPICPAVAFSFTFLY